MKFSLMALALAATTAIASPMDIEARARELRARRLDNY